MPYGQKAHPTEEKKTIPCVRELGIIDSMKAMHANGLSFGAIAYHLNAVGVPTKTGLGSWAGRTVSRILKRSSR